MKKLLALVMTAVLAVSMLACTTEAEVDTSSEDASSVSQTEESSEEESSEDTESSATESSEAVESASTELTDRAGNTIEVKEEYTKIVSYAPSLTEILVDLGYADKIIAITSVDMTEGLPEDVLVFDMMNPDIEAITASQPDLVITTELTAAGQSSPFDEVESAGATVANVPTATSIEGIYADIEFLGELLKAEDKADILVSDMQTAIAEYQALSADITEKKTVYFEISPAPYMYSTGSGSYLNEMIEIIGGENVLAGTEGWLSVTDEMILTSNPSVIFTNVNYADAPIDEIKARSGWDAVDAVANDAVYYVDNMSTSLPNHNIVKGLDEMAKALYPEVYGE